MGKGMSFKVGDRVRCTNSRDFYSSVQKQDVSTREGEIYTVRRVSFNGGGIDLEEIQNWDEDACDWSTHNFELVKDTPPFFTKEQVIKMTLDWKEATTDQKTKFILNFLALDLYTISASGFAEFVKGYEGGCTEGKEKFLKTNGIVIEPKYKEFVEYTVVFPITEDFDSRQVSKDISRLNDALGSSRWGSTEKVVQREKETRPLVTTLFNEYKES